MRAERRKADPKTGKQILCEPPQWKRTWTCHKSHLVAIYRKNAGPEARKKHFVWKITRKMQDPKPARGILC